MSIVHVYLSPHLDDAALSCGGAIWKQTQAGQRVLVINVFAGIPDYNRLSEFAQEKHTAWGSPEDAVATRRAEDQAAMTRLGADVVYWDYLDAIYRIDGTRVLYPDRRGIFGDVDPADTPLLEQLVTDVDAVLGKAGDATCYAPLAIGHHVDHQIVRDVGLTLVERGRRVRWYEDFPYVWWESVETRDRQSSTGHGPVMSINLDVLSPAEWRPDIHIIDVEAKIAAIACYASQIPDLFGSEEAMAEAVRAHARLVGGDHYAERFIIYHAGLAVV